MFISTRTQLFPLPRPARGVVTCLSVRPHTQLNRKWRRTAAGVDLVYYLVEADPIRGAAAPAVADFDIRTLSWLLAEASLAVIWSGDVPYERDAFVERLRAHKSIAMILARPNQHDDWVALCLQHCRPTTEIFQVRPRPPGMPREAISGIHVAIRPRRFAQ